MTKEITPGGQGQLSPDAFQTERGSILDDVQPNDTDGEMQSPEKLFHPVMANNESILMPDGSANASQISIVNVTSPISPPLSSSGFKRPRIKTMK